MMKVEKVKHKLYGYGIVIPDVMKLFSEGCVTVDFDNGIGIKYCFQKDLETIETVNIFFSKKFCKRCIFAINDKCHRYINGAMGLPPSFGKEKRIPKRIYPYCQNEQKEWTGWEENGLNCPKCGSSDTEEVDGSDYATGVTGGHMHCKSCGYSGSSYSY